MISRNLRLTMRYKLRFAEANGGVAMPVNGVQSNVYALSKQNLMKKSMLLVALFILTSVALKAQSPQKINFQSIVRNTNGLIVSNKSVKFKITILSDSTKGTPVYSETHLKTTDAIGLVSLQIGTGTVASGVFSSLNWGNASHFIKLEADFTGGNTYVTLGTQELMSVPYAMYAAKTDTNSLNLTNRLADKAPVNNPTFTGTVGGIDKTMVGLGSVDNTTDASKPVSGATQTALNAKVNYTDTSTMLLNYRTGLNLKAPLASPTFTGTVSGIDKAMVGLGSVDNTSDLDKQVSTATQTALNAKVNYTDTSTMLLNYRTGLNLKAPLASPTFTGTVGGITKAMVGLGSVDNTSDLSKPVSTATQTVLDTKFNKADFPSGSSANEILYWNGTKWISLQPGLPGQVLTMSSDGLSWGCITANTADTASSNPTLVVNTALTAPITIATTGATGIGSATGLPAGVTATWSADVITISGTPTAADTFNYTIPLTGGCGNASATGTITVLDASVPGDVVDVVVTDGLEEGEVIVTFSPPSSDGGSPIIEYEVEATEEEVDPVNSPTISSYSQKNILIENSTITSNDIPLTMAEDTNEPVSGFIVSSIIRTKGLKSPITVKGLKISVSYIFKVFAKNLIGSSPPPSSGKTKKFTPKVFPCAAGPASSNPSLIQNTPLTNITHKTTKATGIGSASGLPQGVAAAWSGSTITISGTPTAAGVFNYTIPITGTSCNNVNATGTITVEAICAVGTASSTPTLILNTALTNITHTTTLATGIGSASGLPEGVTAAWSGNTITISGTPSAMGIFNYSIPLTGSTCNNVNATGTITVTTVCPTTTITYNGYDYKTVAIGTQCWMAENLRTDKYNDDTVIPDETANTSGWGSLTTGARAEYVATGVIDYVGTYGYLYNWHAVDSKKLCPDGWDVPTNAEWTILTTYLGGTGTSLISDIGGKMKSTGTDYWNSPNQGFGPPGATATNSSGFSALPGGYRNKFGGSFNDIRSKAYFWSATAFDYQDVFYRVLYNNFDFMGRNVDFRMENGASVRCLKD